MGLILDLFKGFEVEYDRKNKILYINKAMKIGDFMYLKHLVSMSSDEVKDIRLFDDKLRKRRAYEWERLK